MIRSVSKPICLFALMSAQQLTAADYCAPTPTCLVPAPTCAPQVAEPQAATGVPLGAYVQPPAVGELEGASSGYGVRGLGIRLPEVNLQLPSLQLPSVVRYRRGPQMRVDGATAPFVAGQAAQFGMLSAGGQAAAVQSAVGTLQNAQGTLQSQQQCTPVPPVPPCPSGAGLDRQLIQELLRKEAELQEMNRRFGELEAVVSKLAEQQAAPQPVEWTGVQPSNYQTPARLSRQDAAPPTTTVRSPAPSRPSGPPPSAPVKRTVATRPSVPATPADPSARFGLSPAGNADSFGDWNGAAKR